MRSVGISTSANVRSAVLTDEAPAVRIAARWKTWREMNPNAAIPSSTRPNTASSGRPGYLDTRPPTRLPSPRPNMKLLTTIVTDSILIPKMANRERCQTIWYSNAGKPEKKNKTGAATMSGSRRTFGSADSTPWNKAVSRILIYSSPEWLSLDRVASKDASPAPDLLAPALAPVPAAPGPGLRADVLSVAQRHVDRTHFSKIRARPPLGREQVLACLARSTKLERSNPNAACLLSYTDLRFGNGVPRQPRVQRTVVGAS